MTRDLPLLARSLAWIVALTCLGASNPAAGAPMNLDDPTPRMVVVQIETTVSALDVQYSVPLPAKLEVLPFFGFIRVTIDADVIESFLLSVSNHTHLTPVPGTTSDYEWNFHPLSFDVVSATLVAEMSGIPLLFGDLIFSQSLSTAPKGPVGWYRPKDRQDLHYHACSMQVAPPDGEPCNFVTPVPYEPETGYVNAVGWLTNGGPLNSDVDHFSMFGEAFFHENPEYGDIDGDGDVDVVDLQCSLLALSADLMGDEAPTCVAPAIPGLDLTCDAEFNVIDIQTLIALVVGKPLGAADENGSGVHDGCE